LAKRLLAIGLAVSMGVAAIVPRAIAQSLQGQWQYCLTDVSGTYSGLVLIDAEGHASLSAMGPRNVVTQEGHVLTGGGKVEVVFTSYKALRSYAVDHFHCVIRSSDALDCINRDVAGTVSEPFVFSRVEGKSSPPSSNTAFCGTPNA
jgi:hypothetical protein